ncbi:MAG: omptin family outer membrane protease [Desulfobacteraceae bacterium]|nr:omptin family outer membrane protease [Desulfobacteraceae bacterium]
MKFRRTLIVAVSLCVLACCLPVLGAENGGGEPEGTVTKEVPGWKKERIIPWTEYVSVGLMFSSMVGSHTSYEFGMPEYPYQNPLSRLEFPLDSWWVGGKMRASFDRISIGAEALTNMNSEAQGHMQDSDWDGNNRLEIYSESENHLGRSWIVSTDLDVKIADLVGMPAWLDLRPLVGFRWQNFQMTAHDGLQIYTDPTLTPDPLPGNAIGFEQTYWQYFFGARAAIDLGKPFGLKRLNGLLQLDYGYVEAQNVDHHLLRGRRFTIEDTTGDALHGSVALVAGLTDRLSLSLDGDFLRISTSGTHRWLELDYGIDQSWNYGVNVWSEQNRISLTLAYTF